MGFSMKLLEASQDIQNFFGIFDSERILAIFFYESSNILYGAEKIYFQTQDYICANSESVTVKAGKILEVINYTYQKGYYGFILIHNHPFYSSYPSEEDLNSLEKINRFLVSHNIPIVHFIGIYFSNKIRVISLDNTNILDKEIIIL